MENVLAHLSATDDRELVSRVAARETKLRQQKRKSAPLRIFSFSGLRLYRGEEALEVKRKKPLLLLLYLLYRSSPVGEEQIFDLFWPGEESRARASLRTTLSILRKLLCPEGDVDPLVRQAGGLSLAGEVPVWFDYREFTALIHRGKAAAAGGRPERAVESFRAAVRLYRGPFLENVYEDWTLLIREEAELAYSHALETLAAAAVSNRQWAQAHDYAQRGWRHNSLSTRFCELTMEALIGLERYQETVVMYEEGESVLKRELEIEPTTQMVRLREIAKLKL
jgi:DNA-binding SARP family transcriptional activator